MLGKANIPIALSMIQPEPLPGSYRHNGSRIERIIDAALKEAEMIAANGFDGFILQNMNDMPMKQIADVEAVAYMTAIAVKLKEAFPQLVMGVLLNWDGVSSLAVAEAANADFVRVEHLFTGVEVTSAGLLEGQCCEIAALRKKLQSKIPVYADVYEVHGVPLGAKPVEDAAWETVHEAFADGLFMSGKTAEESIEMIRRARPRIGDTPVFLGGGATGDNVCRLLQYFDGVSVATWIKNGDMKNPIDPARARVFMEEVKKARAMREEKRRRG